MKKLAVVIAVIGILASCSNGQHAEVQRQVDSLRDNSYRPGLGEFMMGIQVHHAKLWFAGKNQNWRLADFEIHEIMESLDDIKLFATDRKETAFIPMLDPALDSINHAIEAKDSQAFKNSFVFLTNTCNNCHTAVHFDFNIVGIPNTVPFSNQLFGKKDSLH